MATQPNRKYDRKRDDPQQWILQTVWPRVCNLLSTNTSFRLARELPEEEWSIETTLEAAPKPKTTHHKTFW